MDRNTDNLSILQEVIAVLSRLGIPYALGGSWASSFYGKPRLTHDADLTVEPFSGREAAFCSSFGEDYYVSLPAVQDAIRSRSSFNVIHFDTGFKVDLFVRKLRPFDASLMARRRAFPVPDTDGQTLTFVSAEDVILLKLEWYRLGGGASERQWDDILSVLQVQAGRLDTAYLDHWAADLSVGDLLQRARQGERRLMVSLTQARLCVVLAAVLWSTSGAFTKVLRENTGLGLNEPNIDPLSIAFWRVMFAATVFLPTVRRHEWTFRPALWLTGLAFALMNALFVSAMALGSSANAILLQYTAPMWVYGICVVVLGEVAERRGMVTLLIGVTGIGVLLIGGWTGGQLPALALALGSGLAYALVMIGLRVQRGASPRWLTAFNHLLSAVVLLPIVWRHPLPSGPQFAVLFVYGTVQMALPYWMLAIGLRRLSPQEVGTLTLIEPVLNPLWAYLASPATETPTVWTLAGGTCIVGALVWRYWPLRKETQ